MLLADRNDQLGQLVCLEDPGGQAGVTNPKAYHNSGNSPQQVITTTDSVACKIITNDYIMSLGVLVELGSQWLQDHGALNLGTRSGY